jgi:Protein of unknown function (DUF1353)
MAHFTEDVTVVNHLSGRVHQWELCEPMTYWLVDTKDGEFVTAPPKFKTDFASVPRPFWFWLAPWGRHGRAAIVHDFLYQLGAVTDPDAPVAARLRRPSKRETDRIFRHAMGVLDREILTKSKLWSGRLKPLVRVRLALAVPRRWLMWAAVAMFGHRAYKKEQAKGSAPPLEHEMLEDVAAQMRDNPTR